jgi:hypothetical protein
VPATCRGFSIGQRLIDEYLAKSKTQRCSDFRETADKIAKVGFRMFLNTTAAVTNWNAEGTECSLVRARWGACAVAFCDACLSAFQPACLPACLALLEVGCQLSSPRPLPALHFRAVPAAAVLSLCVLHLTAT